MSVIIKFVTIYLIARTINDSFGNTAFMYSTRKASESRLLILEPFENKLKLEYAHSSHTLPNRRFGGTKFLENLIPYCKYNTRVVLFSMKVLYLWIKCPRHVRLRSLSKKLLISPSSGKQSAVPPFPRGLAPESWLFLKACYVISMPTQWTHSLG